MNKTMVITRKMKLRVKLDKEKFKTPEERKEEINRVYQFIRDGQYAQYLGLNMLMGQISSLYYKYNRDISNEEFKKEQREIFLKTNSNLDEINFATGTDTRSIIGQKVRQDFSAMLKNGLAKGERSISNYKRTFPLLINGRNLNFYHEYDNISTLNDKLYENDLKIYIKFVNKIQFEVVLGNPYKSRELRSTLYKIIDGTYKVCQSKISVVENDIILWLSIQIPIKQLELDKNTTVGVKLGEMVTGTCVCNKHPQTPYLVGNAEELLRVKTQLKKQRSRIQSHLKYAKGGHGRKRKLKAYDKLSKREGSFVQNYNHNISKEIVEFAKRNKASKIILEDLTSYKDDEFLSMQWTYSQLQECIKYKALKNGIEVIFSKVSLSDFIDKETKEYLNDENLDKKERLLKKKEIEMKIASYLSMLSIDKVSKK